MVEAYNVARSENVSLREAATGKDATHMHAIQAKDMELRRKEKESLRRELELKEKLIKMQKALDDVRLERTLAVEAMQDMDKERQRSLKKIKKVCMTLRYYSLSESVR